LIIPNLNYRLNPSRAIYVTGEINDEMVARLTPEILLLQNESRDPICVYINSPGGLPRCAESLLNLLNLSNQDQVAPCWIITAVTLQAASAAADLLASGDYSIAFPSSTILHHGVRRFETNPSTLESTSLLSEYLRLSNDAYAMQLAQKIESRFTFRYFSVRDEFAALRVSKSDPEMSDLNCFINIIREKLSKDAKQIWDKAIARNRRYVDLINSATEKSAQISETQTPLQFQSVLIKAIVDFEIKESEAKDFRFGGMRRLVDDFYLLDEALSSNAGKRLEKWCKSFGKLVLSNEQRDEIELIAEEDIRQEKLVEIGRPILQPMIAFFIALCHALQEGENELTAIDAYWLGLVDEVVGEDLWTIRLMEEFEPDPSEEAPHNGDTDSQAAQIP
jgi:ATP-dependent Clp protease protease subunit